MPSTTTQSTSKRLPSENTPATDLVLPAPTPTTTAKSAVLSSLCGRLPVVNHIYGGADDEGLVHRWSVFLDLGSEGRDRCVGSVITDRHVLTAAHCLDNKQLHDITMYFGLYDLREMVQCLQNDLCLKRTPSEFIVHYEYYADKGNNDIAIIRFDKPLNTTNREIEAICLPNYFTYDELFPMRMDDGTVVNLLSFGWGEMGGGELAHTRRVVMLNVTAGSECENSIHSKTICTIGVTEGQDVCQGDSGAPLVWLYKKRMYVVGVVSSGPKCGMHFNKPSIAMRISHFKDWVIAKIKSQ
ncbi:AGAP012036-PA-like protein [Anopheles sinensis]|uniref:AGAP012036-PA-like protein n=1 Tax=Anopheles sinensis TaxID=74873 RepID=A0A084VIK5_ANOSI|nr:AGAP012036-PA-like protein [Anopheles sinensis]